MALPPLVSKTLDGLRGLGYASGAFTIAVAGVALTGGAVPTAVLGVGAALIAAAAGHGVYKEWRNSDQLNTIETFLEELTRRHGRLVDGLDHVLHAEPELLENLPPEARGAPIRVFYELLTSDADKREQLFRNNADMLAALTDHCERRFDELVAQLEAVRSEIGRISSWARSIHPSPDRLLADLAPRPLLYSPVVERTEATRFKFGAMRTGVYGRDQAIAEIETFLADKRKFLWHMVTGPGGAGKSRLALQVCLDAQEHWNAGFIEEVPKDGTLWHHWEPEAPTIIVFDYLLSKADEIAKAVHALQNRAPILRARVRILLLEREATGQWWRRVRAAETGQYEANLQLSRYADESLELGPIGPEDVKRIFDDVLAARDQSASDKDRHGFAEALLRLDPRRRPLYAAFAAEAVAEGGLDAIRRWSPQELTEFVLRRERDVRWPSIVPDHQARWRWENLIALATLMRGMKRDDLPKFRRNDALAELLPTRDAYGDGAVYGDMVGSATLQRLAPIEPDLVGELFCLKRLTELSESEAGAMVRSAWHAGPNPTSLTAFLARRDYADIDGLKVAARLLEGPASLIDGMLLSEQGRPDEAIADFTRVIEMTDAPTEQVAQALNYRGVTHGQQGQLDEAITDHTRVIEMPDAPAQQVAKALNNRGVAHGRQGRLDEAIADHTRVIEGPDAPAELVAEALYNRGVTHGQQGRPDEAIADYTRVIERPDAPTELVAKALNNRGVTHGRQGRPDEAIADHTRVIEMPDAPAQQVAKALNNRGVAHGLQGRPDEAIADHTRVIERPDAPAELVAEALNNRAVTHGQQGRPDEAIADYTRVIELPDAPTELVAEALNNRGVTHGQGRPDEAIADYTRVVELTDAPAQQVVKALYNRGVEYGQQGRPDEEIADYTRVIEMPDATAEQVAEALHNRGVTHGQQGRPDEEIADYTRVIEMPDAPAELVAKALYNRGVTHRQQGRPDKTIADCTRVIEMTDAPTQVVAQAHVARGIAKLESEETCAETRKQACEDLRAALESKELPGELRQLVRGILDDHCADA